MRRTLVFSNPVYLSLGNKQLLVRLPVVEKSDALPEDFKREAVASIPVEDIGTIIIENMQVTLSHALLSALMENNTAVITCDATHHPNGLFLPLDVHYIQQERFKAQIDAGVSLKKQLWQQTVKAKLKNQAAMLRKAGRDSGLLEKYAKEVSSGDGTQCEAKGAQYYWSHLFPMELFFSRSREGDPPNNLLNYGYSILRAMTARCLVGSGLLPTLGIHHRNKYNAYCLADDVMEPYRPFVDEIVVRITRSGVDYREISLDQKKHFFVLGQSDVQMEGDRMPLEVAMQRTTASLARCFEGDERKILYPEFMSTRSV